MTVNGGVTLGQPGPLLTLASDMAQLFNGSTGYLETAVAATTPLDISTGTLTTEAWIKTSLGGLVNQLIVGRNYTTGYYMNTNGAQISLWANGINANVYVPINDGIWHHVVATLTGGIASFYKDGALVGIRPLSGVPTSNAVALDIGRDLAGPGAFFNGSIGHVAVYNTALSAARIAAHYQAGVGQMAGSSPIFLPYDGDAVVNAAESTTSASYVDLTTVGPSSTVYIGPSGKVLVMVSALMSNTALGNQNFMTMSASGATTLAAADAQAAVFMAPGSGGGATAASIWVGAGWSVGVTTFTAKYKVSAGTGTFSNRKLTVIPM
jgi:hypothetical protein